MMAGDEGAAASCAWMDIPLPEPKRPMESAGDPTIGISL